MPQESIIRSAKFALESNSDLVDNLLRKYEIPDQVVTSLPSEKEDETITWRGEAINPGTTIHKLIKDHKSGSISFDNGCRKIAVIKFGCVKERIGWPLQINSGQTNMNI
jgi:hypothetical protein